MKADIDLIRPSPYQPRIIFDLEDLKSEIRKDGLLNDLVVRKRGKFYELIDGERRWRILKDLGWKRVPVRVIDADDAKARLSTYKVNKIRENYTVEEEAKYFKKLAEANLTPWEISKQLKVDSRWVRAHLNVFKFSKDIQKAVWSKQISISHVVALEEVINRNIKEAAIVLDEVLRRRLTASEIRKIAKKRSEDTKSKIKEMRIKVTEEILPLIAPKIPKLETPDEFEKTAEVLKQKAREMRKGNITSESIRQMTESYQGRKEKMDALDTPLEDLEVSIQSIRRLRSRIEELSKEKTELLKEKGFLSEALSFNCPHCNSSCIVYREGNSYWVE
jgi:ParB family chromosome partitioning protein